MIRKNVVKYVWTNVENEQYRGGIGTLYAVKKDGYLHYQCVKFRDELKEKYFGIPVVILNTMLASEGGRLSESKSN